MAQSLDNRINAALRSAARLKDVEQVITDVQAEITATEARKDAEVAKSIDPALTTPQAREARNNAADLEHDIRRLHASLGLLGEKRDKIIADAEEERRRARYEAAKAERDLLARQIRTRYPAIALELLHLARRIEASDVECEKLRLKTAEALARNCNGYSWPMERGGGPIMKLGAMMVPFLGREGGYLPLPSGLLHGSASLLEAHIEADQALAAEPIAEIDPAPAAEATSETANA